MKRISVSVIFALLTTGPSATANASQERIPVREVVLSSRPHAVITTLQAGRPRTVQGIHRSARKPLVRSRIGPPSQKASAIAIAIVLGALSFFACIEGGCART